MTRRTKKTPQISIVGLASTFPEFPQHAPTYPVKKIVGLYKLGSQWVIGNVDSLRNKVEALWNRLELAPDIVVIQVVFDCALQVTAKNLLLK